MFGNDRNQLRKAYHDAWTRFQQGLPLQPLEQQIVTVIQEHPEYQKQISNLLTDFFPESGQTNPFLHMGMHLALREQVATNRPIGITMCFRSLTKKMGSPHEAEHQMMECLGEALWTAQQNAIAPDEQAYLDCLKKLSQTR
ncbi:MAG: DUF1841 family protein [Gammaproteobacteria bacterium]|nr:DUF1841 family protein [Gammaproteobacteria bacterium]MCW8911264.1 DUF1841 family protein [Gammaproteobacteria bacterium]MCW9006224.1 DUF1841 family protein [Gammaproteobacteria bacterium]MCW9055864.1 DUF1841 family protein [Gammaproteobacteria bacterium]